MCDYNYSGFGKPGEKRLYERLKRKRDIRIQKKHQSKISISQNLIEKKDGGKRKNE